MALGNVASRLGAHKLVVALTAAIADEMGFLPGRPVVATRIEIDRIQHRQRRDLKRAKLDRWIPKV